MRPIHVCCICIMSALKIFGTPWLLPQILNGQFVSIDSMNVRTKVEVRSFTHFWDNKGTKEILGRLTTPTLPFLQNFNGLLFEWTLRMYPPHLKSVALPVPMSCNACVNKHAVPTLAMPTLPIPPKTRIGLPYRLFLYRVAQKTGTIFVCLTFIKY